MTVILDYIKQAEPSHQKRLSEMYQLIKPLVLTAEESISWGMPTFILNGYLVHFADHKHHIGFYPSPSGVQNFVSELSEYKYSKGAIQFPYHKTLPVDLIKKIVLFRIDENTNITKII